MNGFKEICIKLRKQDYTLPEIVKITGRPKTSVHFHIRNIPLSRKKLIEIREASDKRMLLFSSNRKGRSERSFIKFDRWDRSMVCLVSHLIFDGEIKQSGCIYNNRSDTLLAKVEAAMKKIYSFEPTRYINNVTGVKRISYFNVVLSVFIREKAHELIKEIGVYPVWAKVEFLRSFFDDEGCMDFRPKENRRQIRGYQKDVSILFVVQKLLSDLEITSRILKPNEIVISGKENLIRFRKTIDFSPGIYMNGNRTNSRWKKSLEKRILLDEAIKSFRN